MSHPSHSLPVRLARDVVPNVRTHGVRTAALRLLRPVALVPDAGKVRELESLPAFRDHVLPRADGDPYFYATNDYLYVPTKPRQRLAMARHHHRFEHDAFVDQFVDTVYGPGISLWTHETTGTTTSETSKVDRFEVRIGRARHHLGEGPLTVTLYVDEQDIRVMSLSFIDPFVADDSITSTSAATTVLICRHQFWQTDRSHNDGDTMLRLQRQPDAKLGSSLLTSNSPMHLCLAAVAGIALACGADSLFGLDEAACLAAAKSDYRLGPNYSECWTKFNATRSSPHAWKIPLPLDSTPIEQVSSSKRRRARARRRLLDEIELSSFRAFNELRRSPLDLPELPTR
jgi:uncharacterized protein VirK/YbjX